MLITIAVAYGIIAFVLFALFILFGKVLKKISLGNGVSMGVLNSSLLSVLWPLTLVCCAGGMLYECIRLWKRL